MLSKPHLRATVLSSLVLITPFAAAQQSGTPTGGASGALAFQTILALGLVIALIFVCALIFRKFNGVKPFGQGKPLKIVGGLMIGTRERIVLLEVEDTWIVVGVVPGQIKTLHTMPKGETPQDQQPPVFNHWLKHFKDRSNASSTQSE